MAVEGGKKDSGNPQHKRLRDTWWPTFCSRHRPSNAQTSPASLRRALSPTLPQHLARLLPAGVFTAILLFVTRLPRLETLSDFVKDTVRATVGWLWWLNNAWNQQWARGSLPRWVVGWGQALVSICGDLTFSSVGFFRLMDQSMWMKCP